MGQKSTILAVGLIVFAIILTILFIVSRVIGGGGDNKDDSNQAETSNQVQEVNSEDRSITELVPVSDIITTPSVYEGYNLSVNAPITTWATNRSFYFASQTSSIFGGNTRGALLVVSQEPFQLPQDPTDDVLGVGEIANVTANGKVVILNREQLESLLGVNLDDPKYELGDQVLYRWKLGPVLLLDKYQVVENN